MSPETVPLELAEPAIQRRVAIDEAHCIHEWLGHTNLNICFSDPAGHILLHVLKKKKGVVNC